MATVHAPECATFAPSPQTQSGSNNATGDLGRRDVGVDTRLARGLLVRLVIRSPGMSMPSRMALARSVSTLRPTTSAIWGGVCRDRAARRRARARAAQNAESDGDSPWST
jgi:hypothetical protein